MSSWTTPADLRAQLEKRWQCGDLLRARLADTALYPLSMRLKIPTARQLSDDFAAVADWLGELRKGSKEEKGYGYTLHWQRRQNRVHGANELPVAATVDSEQDALALIDKQKQARQFSVLADETLLRFPELCHWLDRKPLQLLEYSEHWPKLLAVLETFRRRPRPNCYLRELDIPGVHSKFIERHRGLLGELLDAVLPEEAITSDAGGVRGFNCRYGLRDKPVRVRFRILDSALTIGGLTDLEIPLDDFANLVVNVDTVFITENDINGLVFPSFPSSLVIFGLGYGVDTLANVPWLSQKKLYYWGDIDTHGFAILNRLRNHHPHVHSLLMDQPTLEAHRELWGKEEPMKRFAGELPNLTDAEQVLYRQLLNDEFAAGLRLEQEHISPRWLTAQLAKLHTSR